MSWIPPGFAHGFSVLSEAAGFLYYVYNPYDANSERTILWNDPDEWPLDGQPILSRKDADGIPFQHAEVCADSLSESAS
jgi:dTDP-4-dehydrorhamnose 3,5-epimerase